MFWLLFLPPPFTFTQNARILIEFCIKSTRKLEGKLFAEDFLEVTGEMEGRQSFALDVTAPVASLFPFGHFFCRLSSSYKRGKFEGNFQTLSRVDLF